MVPLILALPPVFSQRVELQEGHLMAFVDAENITF